MFKNPLADLKTTAPIRSSDRRRLKQGIADKFQLSPEDAELLVPDGLKSVKFKSHQGKPGVAYLSQDGDPLWFTLGKGSQDLVPTVYTLWKKYDLLPTITTPEPVIPRIQDGADLMIPDVVSWPSPLGPNELVSISKYIRPEDKRSPPFAVGRAEVGVDSVKLGEKDAKGKAVIVWHAWKDGLWNIGSGGEMPPDVEVEVDSPACADQVSGKEDSLSPPPPSSETQSPEVDAVAKAQELESELSELVQPSLAPDEITEILRTSLLLSLATPPPSSSFPMLSTTFYTSHILPYRPAHLVTSFATVDVKHSSAKSLSAFLKSMEKAGLLTLKSQRGDIVVTGVNGAHPDVKVVGMEYKTMKEVEENDKKRRERENEEMKKRGEKVVEIREYYQPFGQTLPWFKEAGQEASTLILLADLQILLNAYITSHNLANAYEKQFVNVSEDPVLLSAITDPIPSKPKPREEGDRTADLEFLKREDIMKRLVKRMQACHEICVNGKAGEVKEGVLLPVTVRRKAKHGRTKGITTVTGLEPFAEVVGSVEDVAEEVRKSGFGASVAPLTKDSSAFKILMQGNQTKVVVDLLTAKGLPRKWIEGVGPTK
ncbi:hypothetical protein NEOLEDRAFT_1134285 [Neolentinus lepideus HHB14362 ss-1]|uniref:SUI1 domain-containing protein n=1 Tax=Neolentinus lepideus HHB14362 ss-1 TaxID=1314782 RepID=A0A165SEV9_9AGAM|nr:hypothetical protein NEOLEDRAFT_1134285 [Neolentinus lepideus HHB14362 ss-1]